MVAIEEDILNFSVHVIDHETNSVEDVKIETDDITTFTTNLLLQIRNVNNKRSFKFAENSSGMAKTFSDLLMKIDTDEFDNEFKETTNIVSKKLCQAQIEHTINHSGIKPPKKGSLVVVVIQSEEIVEVLITKINLESFIDIQDAIRKAGLPDEKAVQKSCFITYQVGNEKVEVQDVFVSDSGTTISRYWSNDFLELIELTSNETNTKNAFNIIEQIIVRNCKKKSKKDYVDLRNNLVGYFQTSSSFNLDSMIDYVIGDFQPDNEEVNISKIKESLTALKENKKFDSSFDIELTAINTRFKRVYKISDEIELRTINHIENLNTKIVASIDEYGEKILKIRNISEEVYQSFKEEA